MRVRGEAFDGGVEAREGGQHGVEGVEDVGVRTRVNDGAGLVVLGDREGRGLNGRHQGEENGELHGALERR